MKREEIDLVKKFATEAGLTVRGDSIIANGQRLMLGETVTLSDIAFSLNNEIILMDIESPADMALLGRLEQLAKKVDNYIEGLEEIHTPNVKVDGLAIEDDRIIGHAEYDGHELIFQANTETGGIRYFPKTQEGYEVIAMNIEKISEAVKEGIENFNKPLKVDIEDIEL